MSHSSVLLFDLDGTLTDPRPGIVRCMKYALSTLGAPCPPDAALAAFIGPPLRGTFATLLATSDRQRIEQAMALYREQYGDTGLYENHLCDGIGEMLEHARVTASALFVATSKMRDYAARIVTHIALERYFTGVYGSEPGGRFDDKVELLAHLLATEKAPAAATVMIGDRAVDIVAAKANGLRSIGVLWGYGSQAELVEAGADRLCRAPSDLAACLSHVVTR